MAEFEQALTGGSNPSVTGDGYVEGFYALEPYYYNVICCDTIAEGVQNLLHEYIDEVVKVGKFPIGVACADTTAAFNERKTKAAGFNDEQIAFYGQFLYGSRWKGRTANHGRSPSGRRNRSDTV